MGILGELRVIALLLVATAGGVAIADFSFALAPKKLDALGTGRLEGELYSKSKLKKLSRYLARRGIKVRMDGDDVLPSRVDSAFDGHRKQMIFRSNPTKLEVYHELAHFRHYRAIGPDAYNNPIITGLFT